MPAVLVVPPVALISVALAPGAPMRCVAIIVARQRLVACVLVARAWGIRACNGAQALAFILIHVIGSAARCAKHGRLEKGGGPAVCLDGAPLGDAIPVIPPGSAPSVCPPAALRVALRCILISMPRMASPCSLWRLRGSAMLCLVVAVRTSGPLTRMLQRLLQRSNCAVHCCHGTMAEQCLVADRAP